MLNGCLLLPSHIPEGTAGYWHCHDKTAYICPCLTHFHSLQTEEVREDEDEWNEEKTTAGCRYQVGTDWLADGLCQHVGEHDGGYQWETDNLPAQSHGTYGYYIRVAAEQLDDRFCENEAYDGANCQEHRTALDAEVERITYATIQLRPITESAKRLETLSQTDYDGIGEEGDASDDAHAGNGCITVCACCHVEHQCGYAAQSLS